MALTTRGRRQATNSLFPGNYWVFRNLSLRVPEDGISGHQVSFAVLRDLLPRVVEQLRARAERYADWRSFRDINENRLELLEPDKVSVLVQPTTWWCTACGRVYSGPVGRVGIRDGHCPGCMAVQLVQLASVFMCPTCHNIENLEANRCPTCGDSRNVFLEGGGGRRREYRWRCRQHADFNAYVRRNCRHDQTRMALKSTGGRLYNTARVSDLQRVLTPGQGPHVVAGLDFRSARARVAEVVVGRIPIADFNAFFGGRERSLVEPFINPATGHFRGLVSQLETDGIVVTLQRPE